MTWKRFPHYWPYVSGIHRWSVVFPHIGPEMQSFHVSYEQTVELLVIWDIGTLTRCHFNVLTLTLGQPISLLHDDVIEWKHFLHYWPFVRGIHRLPVNSPHKGQWRGALMFSLICSHAIGWVNNREAGDLRRYRAHNDDIVMAPTQWSYHEEYREINNMNKYSENLELSRCKL